MASGGGPMNVTPSEAHSSANAGSSATKPQPTHAASARLSVQRPAELLVVEVGDALAGVAEDDGLVGGAHERRVPLVLGVHRDDADAVAVLRVELAHGPDQAHGGLAPVHHSDAFEHPRDPLSVNPAPVDQAARSGRAAAVAASQLR